MLLRAYLVWRITFIKQTFGKPLDAISATSGFLFV